MVHDNYWGIEYNKICTDKSCSEYTLVRCFVPITDPELANDGVLACAQVHWDGHKSRNRIVFSRGDFEASVHCVHTAVYDGPISEIPDATEMARSTEGRPVDLPPEEHFFALQSYVQGIIEFGIFRSMTAPFHTRDEIPLSFNSAMRQQIINAIGRVSPMFLAKETAELVLNEVGNTIDPDWFVQRYPVLDEVYDFIGAAIMNEKVSKKLDELGVSPINTIVEHLRDKGININNNFELSEENGVICLDNYPRDRWYIIKNNDAGIEMARKMLLEDISRDGVDVFTGWKNHIREDTVTDFCMDLAREDEDLESDALYELGKSFAINHFTYHEILDALGIEDADAVDIRWLRVAELEGTDLYDELVDSFIDDIFRERVADCERYPGAYNVPLYEFVNEDSLVDDLIDKNGWEHILGIEEYYDMPNGRIIWRG